jgi:maleate cis-trans isomerase
MKRKNSQPIHKVGFITPPAWFDISPTEFLRIAPDNTVVMQTVMRLPDFDYSVEQFVSSVPELTVCFNSLAAAGADVVAQFGFPFSLAHGWLKAQAVHKSIQGNSKTKLVMMGVEVVHALRRLNCKSMAIASTYYSGKMSEILNKYLTEAGFNILQSENWQSQGMAEDTESGSFIGAGELDPMDWQTPAEAVEKVIRDVSRSAPSADCILVTGGGMRLLDMVERLEGVVKKPIVAGDLTLYWGILRRIGIQGGVKGHGMLLTDID